MNADAWTHAKGLTFGPTAPRIAVGLLWQETNCFNPRPTEAQDFVVDEGEAVLSAYEKSATALGGLIGKLRAMGAQPVPVLAAKARPGGPVRDGVILDLVERLVSGIAAIAPDAVCLELHGSTAGETIEDAEGLLLERLRQVLGRDIPIVAALDLHGHLTRKMAGNADFLTAYRTHPHADMEETGARAAAVLAAMMTRNVKPIATRHVLPFLALFRDETHEPPMAEIHGLVRDAPERADPTFLDLSIFNVHPFLDFPGMGQVVLAYGDGNGAPAGHLAERVARRLWQLRGDFSGSADEMETVFARIADRKGDRPVAIGDQGDSVLAGTPGDSVELARFAMEHHPGLRGFIPVCDPLAVETAREAGVGARVTLALGGGVSPNLAPLAMTGTVERVTDGQFANTGAYMTGLVNNLGPCVVVRGGANLFLVTSNAPAACDPGMLAHAGYDIGDFDYLVLKSGNHYRLSFEALCQCIVAATPGLSARNPRHLPHRRARPIFPCDPDIVLPEE